MKYRAYICIQEDCGEICRCRSILGSEHHPKLPEYCPYYGGDPCEWKEIEYDEADETGDPDPGQ